MSRGEGITVRVLTQIDEFEEIGRLQHEALGMDENDIFPPKLITIAHENGGVVVGAFDPEGNLVGFAFNFPGSRYGKIIEWSYLSRIVPELQDQGLRKRLKLAQRQAVLDKDIETICWAFDPLDASRARLSFHILGAICREYATDFPDPLNDYRCTTIKDDNLIVEWNLNEKRVLQLSGADPREPELPLAAFLIKPSELRQSLPPSGVPGITGGLHEVAVPVPADCATLEFNDPKAAEAWRKLVRSVLMDLLSDGHFQIEDVLFLAGFPRWFWYILRNEKN